MSLFGPPSQRTLDKRLMKAIDRNDLKKAKAAIDAGADVNRDADRSDKYFVPPIVFVFSKYNPRDYLELLISKGADINAQRYDGKTALHCAVDNEQLGIVHYLLSQKADTTIIDKQMETAADLAEKKHRSGLARLIRGENAGAKEVILPAVTTGWRLTAPDEVSHVSEKPAIGYRLTEIFNFTKRNYVLLSQSLETKNETMTTHSFAALADTTLVAQAEKAFTVLKGVFPEGYDTGTLPNKPQKPLPSGNLPH